MLETTPLLEGERTFFVAEVRSAESLGEDVEELERERDASCLSALHTLVSTGCSGRELEEGRREVNDGVGSLDLRLSCLMAVSAAVMRSDGLPVVLDFKEAGESMPHLEEEALAESERKTARGSIFAGEDMIMVEQRWVSYYGEAGVGGQGRRDMGEDE